MLAVVDWRPEAAVLRFFDSEGRPSASGRILEGTEQGTRAVAFPGESAVAYTLLAGEGADPGSDGRIALIDLRTGAARTIASGVDIRSAPVFSPDGGKVAYRKRVATSESSYDEIWIQTLDGMPPRLAASDPGSLGLYLVDWGPAGLRYLSVDHEGSYLHSPTWGGPIFLDAKPVGDFAVSPSTTAVAFLTEDTLGVLQEDGNVQSFPLSIRLFGLTWSEEQGLTSSAIGIGEKVRLNVGTQLVQIEPSPAGRLDVPVRATGKTGLQILRSLALGAGGGFVGGELVLRKDDGRRIALAGSGYLDPVGWLDK